MSDFVETGMNRSYKSMFGRNVEYPTSYCQDYYVRGTEEELVDGKILKSSKNKLVHPQDKFRGLRAIDFALENIIAVGALDSLKEGYLNYNASGEVSDSLEGPINNIISAVDAEQKKGESE